MNIKTNIEYAVMINTRGTATDADIGLYNGSICLITGRPSYSEENPPVNPPDNPVTTESQNIWKEGLIAKDSLGNPEEVVDPTLGGSYSTMTSAELKLVNNPPGLDGETLFDYLNAAGINLFRCELLFFVVIDGMFSLRGTYSIENLTNEEHLVSLTAVDGFLTIHKDTLKTQVSTAGFPAAPDDSQGKFIPLCIGRIPQAALLPMTGQIVRQMLCKRGMVHFAHAAGTSGVKGAKLLRNRNRIFHGALPLIPLALLRYWNRIRTGNVESPMREVPGDDSIFGSSKWDGGSDIHLAHPLIRVIHDVGVPEVSVAGARIEVLAIGIERIDVKKPLINGWSSIWMWQLCEWPRDDELVELWIFLLVVVLTQKTTSNPNGGERKCEFFHDALPFLVPIIYSGSGYAACRFVEVR